MLYSAVTMLIAAFSELAQIITDLWNNNVHLLNCFKYMDMEEKAEARKEEKIAAQPLADRGHPYEIAFEKMSFRYPGSGGMALQDIDLRIRPGEKLAYISKIATVFQDFSLFAFSIAENVAASR